MLPGLLCEEDMIAVGPEEEIMNQKMATVVVLDETEEVVMMAGVKLEEVADQGTRDDPSTFATVVMMPPVIEEVVVNGDQ